MTPSSKAEGWLQRWRPRRQRGEGWRKGANWKYQFSNEGLLNPIRQQRALQESDLNNAIETTHVYLSAEMKKLVGEATDAREDHENPEPTRDEFRGEPKHSQMWVRVIVWGSGFVRCIFGCYCETPRLLAESPADDRSPAHGSSSRHPLAICCAAPRRSHL